MIELAFAEISATRERLDWDFSRLPADGVGTRNLQVAEHLRLVETILHTPERKGGIEYVFGLNESTLMAVGVFDNPEIPGISGTPFSLLYQPGEATMRDVLAVPREEPDKRAELVTERVGNKVKRFVTSTHGFLGSKQAVLPWQMQLLNTTNSPDVVAIGLSWKGAEGTTQPFENGTDSFSMENGVEQVNSALKGIGPQMGWSEEDWLRSQYGFIGHSYGGLMAFRLMLQHGNLYPRMQIGCVTPVIEGATRANIGPRPAWLQDAIDSGDTELLAKHVYILDKSPFGKLVRLMGTIENDQVREKLLNFGEMGIIQGLLRYYIGMEGLGGESVLPVYLQSLRDKKYTQRDVRLLDNAPYMAGDETLANMNKKNTRPFAMVVGGKKERGQGDHVLASKHMLAFAQILENITGVTPCLINDPGSPHHPRERAINELIHFIMTRSVFG